MRPTITLVLVALACAASFACGSSATPVSRGGPAAEAGADLASLDLPAGIAETSIGPIDVAPGVEKTVCITKRLGNTQDLAISGYTASLAPGSHHLILYTTNDTAENLTPTPCRPFVGLAGGDAVPLVLVNERKLEWKFPSGVAVEVPKNQMLRIEAHYINTSAADLMGLGAVSFQGTPKASAPSYVAADFLFWGTDSIHIPPGATYSTRPTFQAGTAGTHLVSISTHQHSLGTGIKVWASAQAGDMSRPIANDLDWSNPAWSLLSPTVDFDGTSGLTYQCDWNNTTPWTITFGESALDEMCFVGGYYYPGHGFDLKITGSPTAAAPSGTSDAGAD
ncbi:MAG TPA: hypothetical protein VKU41_26900 [Polyangiaceae bacterium]|nr:hypothetical protein [Polyangiaceae bacterium]